MAEQGLAERSSAGTSASFTPLVNLLLDQELSPLFWPALRLDKPSAWVGHVPFAHWIVCAGRPVVLVELGSHNGVSYSAFCDSNIRSGGGGRFYAVDTWEGDVHVGYYADDVYSDFKAYHDKHFGAFSTMLRMTFDDGLLHISDGIVDVLHIDGLHSYEAVKHDYETWLPKMSDRGVVLFHDTNERRDDFGVWKFWAELTNKFPSFEFLHSHGLGVLCVGKNAPAPVIELCSVSDPAQIAAIRDRFEYLGERWVAASQLIALQARMNLVERFLPIRQVGRARRFILGLMPKRRARPAG
jgi:hypothetical protein